MIKNSFLSEETVAPSLQQVLSKVPEVTIFFWIIKTMATTVGETAADFLNFNFTGVCPIRPF